MIRPLSEQIKLDELSNLIRKRQCISFIGSGLSNGLYLDWNSLVDKLCSECGVNNNSSKNSVEMLMKRVDEARRKNPTTYYRVLSNEFGKTIVNTKIAYSLLIRSNFKCYITTNFDPLLAYESKNHNCGKVFAYPSHPAHLLEKRDIFYIHGYIQPNKSIPKHLVLGKEDFDKAYNESQSLLPGFLKQVLTYHPIVFLGCGLREPPIKHLFDICRDIRKDIEVLHSAVAPKRYILSPFLYKREEGMKSSMGQRDYDGELLENTRFGELDINVIRYERKDDNHTGLLEIFEQWADRAPVIIGSGFEGANLP